jgi:hypothetical protein
MIIPRIRPLISLKFFFPFLFSFLPFHVEEKENRRKEEEKMEEELKTKKWRKS